MKTSAIAPSIERPRRPGRSVESRNAPNGVVLPPARASAPSRMSRIEPTTKTTAPSQKKPSSLVLEVDEHRPRGRATTPAVVSAFGVTRVRARPDDRAGRAAARARRVALLAPAEARRLSHVTPIAFLLWATIAACDEALDVLPGRRDDVGDARERRCRRATSSQKWLPVAMTANQTQAGQSSQSTLKSATCRTTDARTTPTISASARVEARHRRVRVRGELDEPAAVVERRRTAASVSMKPIDGNNRGGAVGSRT